MLSANIADNPLSLGGVGLHLAYAGEQPTHRHETLELNFVTSGTASYILEGQRVNLRSRSMLWIFPEQDHFLLEQAPDFEMWVVLWTPEAVELACRHPNTAALKQKNPPGIWHKRANEERFVDLNRLCEYVRYEGKDPDVLNTGVLFLLAASWRIFQAADQQLAGNLHPAVAYAAKLLRERTPPPGVEELSREVGLSSSRLSRLFSSQIGCGLVPFRNRQCVERFKRLYDDGQLSITEAADKAGFGSYAQFHRVFTEAVGCSPKEWRRQSIATTPR